jgi:hypothetical protein
MKQTINKWREDENDYTLEPSDLDYLSNEFDISQGSIGIELVSKKKPKLSIHLGSYDVKFTWDISEMGGFLAMRRVSVGPTLLTSCGKAPHEFKNFLPTTTDQLEDLILKFCTRPMGDVKPEEIVKFLDK